MPRITLGSFAFTPELIEGSQRARAFVKTWLRFPHNYQRSLVPLSILLLLIGAFVSLKAQGTLTAIEKNRKQVKMPAADVTRVPHTTRKSEPIRGIPITLELGDELIGKGAAVTVKVLCGRNTEFLLSGGHKARFLGETEERCTFDLDLKPGAAVNVRAAGPTSIRIGNTRLGTRRTQYEIRMPGIGSPNFIRSLIRPIAIPITLVFEGDVEIQSPLFSGIIKQGEKLVAEGAAAPAIQRITLEDILEAAKVYASIDVSQIKVLNAGELNDAYLKLLSLHQEILANPDNPAKRDNLESEYQKLGIGTKLNLQGNRQSQFNQAVAASGTLLAPANKKSARILRVTNDCPQMHMLSVKLKGLSWVHVITNAESMIPGGGAVEAQLEIDATKKKAGSYSGIVVITCKDCAKGDSCGGIKPLTIDLKDDQPKPSGIKNQPD
jgi:hypothetical protein